ncbi:MAG: hypothetical protein PHV74_04770 [Dehalococcoidia bacterium]|nr:hypothetical protein [Dehalococcoidia bacterium]
MSRITVLIATLVVVALLLIPTVALAQPNVCGFYGSVTLDGASVATGTTVKALVDSVEVKSVTTTGSNYAMYVDGNYAGKTVTFTVGTDDNDVAETALWEAGANKALNLSASKVQEATGVAKITLSPAKGIVTKVTGTGFTPKATVGIMWNAVGADSVLERVTVDSAGGFSTIVVAQTGAAGTYTIYAAESATRMANATLTIDATASTPGKDGKDGKDGINGTNGKDGINGTNGTNGEDGEDASSVMGIIALLLAVNALGLAVFVLLKLKKVGAALAPK